MKQHPTERKLSPAEQVLQQQLNTSAEPERPVQWQELQDKLGPALKAQTKVRWPLWLAPVAVAATVAWLMLLQPQTTSPVQTPNTPMLLAGNYNLDALDKQLQRAYLEGADPAEIDALWQRRAALTGEETSS